MSDIPIKDLKKAYSLEKIKNHLEKNNKGYVLITCSHPSKDGKMNVELNYSGDEDLASYLVDGAKNVLDSGISEIKDSC